jgi:hypothetical protein
MKNILVAVFSLLLFFSCGKRCSDKIINKPLNSKLDACFGVYKMGNYWVYENQDQTKRDSFYVSSYSRFFDLKNSSCQAYETLKFSLICMEENLLSQGTSYFEGSSASIDFGLSSTFFSSDINALYFDHQDNKDTVYASSYTSYAWRARFISFKMLNSSNYSGNLFEVYDQQDTLYLQEYVGIIGWKKNNETFNLIKQYLKP